MIRVAINGWGRIGRILFRAALRENSAIDVVALNSRAAEASWVAHLLKYDSVHGVFDAEVRANKDANTLVVNGREIKILAESDIGKLPWGDLGVDLVVESTGAFRDRKNASRHLDAGSKKVIITAPGKEPDVTIVPGVNDEMYDHAAHNIISIASCTTNCLAPMAKVLNDEFGINRGFMTTVHSYTNDQKILDGRHKDLRRARAAAMSIIPTTTGAAAAVGIVLPLLAGKLDGIALRVPTANVSIVDLVAELRNEVTREEVNGAFEEASRASLSGILAVSHEPLVSIDYIGTNYSSVVDAEYTSVIGGKGNFVKVLSWYDNEWGYSCRVVDMIKRIAELGL
ncbi:MAG TPA: type I glyceraldehyde-3-phosphate dehydrogenase [Candidatus Bathyarchaeia archaeon]|nr:type I glyceraldehyde-3-phosphate dehydrogenase [Candidatus Bathyarchaeia archaeon]